jgi:broad specificity phosphatase PhoE
MATSLLLRHGQYKKEPLETLTTLGMKQARLAGRRLREYSISEIHHSTMPRARETAEIIKKMLELFLSSAGKYRNLEPSPNWFFRLVFAI